jgi:cob(I)alamin adenosyltransferase
LAEHKSKSIVPLKIKKMSSDWKIYTKQGDKGQTSLLGGSRVEKHHPRIEAYGTLDELNAFTGFLRDLVEDNRQKAVLLSVLENIFIAESILAADSRESRAGLQSLRAEDIFTLENEIDFMNESLPVLTNFILPGGHQAVSAAHIARTVCRRAERLVVNLTKEYDVEEIVIQYLNRLSDYFFVLARKLSMDTQTEEILWKPRQNN